MVFIYPHKALYKPQTEVYLPVRYIGYRPVLKISHSIRYDDGRSIKQVCGECAKWLENEIDKSGVIGKTY